MMARCAGAALGFQGRNHQASDVMAALFGILRLATIGAIAVFTCKMLQIHGVIFFNGTAMDEILRAMPAKRTSLLPYDPRLSGWLLGAGHKENSP